jgi:putative flippase GtrA
MAVTVLLPLSLWVRFYLHEHVTFRDHARGRLEPVRFLFASLAAYGVNIVVLTVLMDYAGLMHQLAQLLSILLVSLIHFTVMQRFVFVAFYATEK